MPMSAEDIAIAGSETPMGGARRAIAIWLSIVAVLLIAMIVLGGLTRITDSGLSITEWRPVTGAVPPLSQSAWLQEFEKYKRIPEFERVNPDMSLTQFKAIYWWEWSHRFLGRLIGVVVLLPMLFFIATRRVGPRLSRRLLLIFLLGAAQGALGWYMVKSGLSVRIDVSQYRLAAHLLLAFVIYGAVILTLFDVAPVLPRAGGPTPRLHAAAIVLAVLVFMQVGMGAIVAGLDAGLASNTWPLMDGRFVPRGLTSDAPWYRNVFENGMAAQFAHRLLAYLVLALTAGLWFTMRKHAARSVADLALALVVLQAGLGIATLIFRVPLPLAIIHQLGAVAVFTAVLALARATR